VDALIVIEGVADAFTDIIISFDDIDEDE